MKQVIITPELTRKVWRNLYSGDVPLVTFSDLRTVISFCDTMNHDISRRSYMPSLSHGYLGIEKSSGVARFIPLLTKEDMAVYYHLCGEIGDRLVKNVKNIYGGWQAIPTPNSVRGISAATLTNREASYYQQNYYSSAFSSAAWFQQYRNFNEVLTELVNSGDPGNFVAITDVANFYDSIEVVRLTRKLRRADPDLHEYIDLLEIFLGYWNRRSTGYHPSSRGIPQEIISDASRSLSHFYLQDFDEKFLEYCSTRGLTYIRWADDFLIFGRSTKALEDAIYAASQLLLYEGLNLSAPKTRILSRRNFEWYRGLRLLDAVQKKDTSSFRSQLQRIQRATKPLKLDTVFRASIGFASLQRDGNELIERRFIFDAMRKNPSFIGTLNPNQMLKLLQLSDDPASTLRSMARAVSSKDATSPKAKLLTAIRNRLPQILKTAVPFAEIERAVAIIQQSSSDSEILNTYCLPAARKVLDSHLSAN